MHGFGLRKGYDGKYVRADSGELGGLQHLIAGKERGSVDDS